ncbi:MAG: mucoidy inhibitor MuiA family protein [Myxococcus sp.]|nr:mucoidy inhibitor MuiA family protein [Myxococcus sp.]
MMTLAALLVLASTTAPDEVVVYPDRAQVTRVTPVSCGSRTALVFEGVPPAAVADSFRARMSEGTVDGLRAELVRQEKVFGDKADALEKKLEQLTDDGRALDDQLARTESQRALATRLREVAEQGLAKELAAEKPDVKTWQAALDTPLATTLAMAKQAAELQARRRDLNRAIDEVRRQLEEVRVGAQRQSFRVEVLVTCPQGRSAQLSLTYLVGGASWTPAYEARAAEAARSVDFSTFATVTQVTGEDWSGVRLSLSTAVPSQNATPPTMNKLLVGATERPPEKKVLTRRDEYVESASIASGSVSGGKDNGLVAKAQGLSVQLQVPDPAKVPGDGAPVRLFVGETKLSAAFELRVMPKLYPVAFRVAEVSNTGAWPLLPGRVDAFRSTGLVGRYELERVAQGAPFALTFGIDDTIRVKRTIDEELKNDTGLFNSKKRFTYGYTFDLANYGKAPVELSVADHLPVPEVNDIEVALTEKTTAGAQVNKASGVATWKVALKPQEKKRVVFSFRVDVPTSYEMGGL